MLDLPPTEVLRRATRAERVALCGERLGAAREHVAMQHTSGAVGSATARAWADAVDAVVRALLAAALADAGDLPTPALVAVGGYGRAELCPGSDLDLWFVIDHHDTAGDARLGRLAEEVLYPLWDLRLQVSHSVRTVAESVAMGRDDLTVATALLDLRLVAGDAALHHALAATARRELFDVGAIAFVHRLVDEKAARHARFGDTVYLLEPDLKNGQGAYRDLLVSLWAAKARFGVRDFSDLVALGQSTARQVAHLVAARDFFLRIRTAAHRYARRRQDRLNFEVQEAIAPALVGGGPQVAPAPDVEALMRSYYLHAKAVIRDGDRLLERCAADEETSPSVRPIDATFVLQSGQLATADPEALRARPSEMVRLFRVALDHDVEVHGDARDRVADLCARPDTPARLGADPAAAAHFLALLTDERDRRSPSLLEQMHDLGLLAALMPEFAPCTARVQHDIYHVFTVDQHSLYAVGFLKRLARGELERELPVATQAMRELGEDGRKLPLYLGTLLHDVGKPLGKGHSEKGARLARAIGRRLGVEAGDLALVELLVLRHLTLSHLSQRRDLSDVALIARLAADLGDEETLRTLYLLTVADMSMVAPGNLTAWKEQLLRELYGRTLAHLRRGPDLAGVDHSALVTRRKQRAAAILDRDEATLAAWFDGLPDRYFAQMSARVVAQHVIWSERRAAGDVVVEATHHPRSGWSELTVIADDHPGLLARIAGVLLANRIDVLSAHIASRRTASPEAIDVFVVRDRYGRALDDARVGQLRADLAGAVAVEALVAERRDRSALPPRVTPAVPTEIEIDQHVSSDYTVVDVYAQDRPGVLYTITHTLSSLGLDIGLSKVATEAERVADVFYVRHADGRKLGPPDAERLRAALAAALAELP